MEINDIHSRQLGIIHPDKLNKKIAIIGAGSIGSWTTLLLLKLGCKYVSVFDFDDVAEVNIGSQIYKMEDVGQTKAAALRRRLSVLTESPVMTYNTRWTPEVPLGAFDIVIAAVDSITPRKDLFLQLKDQENKLYIDPRMAGNAIEIYTLHSQNQEEISAYEKTLFEEADTIPVACSEKSVAYNVFVIAGIIGDLIAKDANELPIPKEIIVDLYNLTLFK